MVTLKSNLPWPRLRASARRHRGCLWILLGPYRVFQIRHIHILAYCVVSLLRWPVDMKRTKRKKITRKTQLLQSKTLIISSRTSTTLMVNHSIARAVCQYIKPRQSISWMPKKNFQAIYEHNNSSVWLSHITRNVESSYLVSLAPATVLDVLFDVYRIDLGVKLSHLNWNKKYWHHGI